MSILPILQYPDPRLREKCVPAKDISDRIRKILNDMAETMYDAPGIGLAASQVGVPERLVVIDLGEDDESGRVSRLYKLVNPEIVRSEGTTEYEEGCLSIPSIRETVKRSAFVEVHALDENGKTLELEAEGLLAICLQHEIDHLDGILFIDHLSRIKRELIKRKLRK